MAIDRRHLEQHLAGLQQAFGGDLSLPIARAELRQAPPARSVQPPRPTGPLPTGPLPTGQPPTGPLPTAAPPRPRSTAPRPAPVAQPPAAPAAPRPTPVIAPTAAAAAPDPLTTLRTEVLACTRCKLHVDRTNVVFGEGNPRARVLFVGEAPGATEDRTGRPFVGPAGQLLDRILNGAMGLQRSDVFIANINKCRPPGNRAPEADEVAACLPYLKQQVDLIRPEVIVCLGRTAAQNLLGTTASTTALRGRTLDYHGTPVVVTWHPAYLLRDPSHKRETWDDIKRVNALLGLPEVPPTPNSGNGNGPNQS